MRERFPTRRRLAVPAHNEQKFTLEPPPELPRTIEVGAVRKALPWVVGVVIIGVIVMMVITGFRQANPMYLMFMGVMAVTMITATVSQGGGNAEMSTPEVNSERAEYLRYLSLTSAKIREAAATQRANAEWSHPEPEVLAAHVGSPRMWERGSTDCDYLKIRVGLDDVQLASTVKVKPVDSELDLEPVTKTALQHMRAVQQSIPHCPKAIDLVGLGLIGVYGDHDLFAAAMRAWICQLVCWHTPKDTAVAVVSPHLESRWDWMKWLPHNESHDIDGAGPARYLGATLVGVEAMLGALLKDRAEIVDEKGNIDATSVSKAHKHVLLVVDDPAALPHLVRRIAARDGVTVIVYRGTAGPDRDYAPHGRELLLSIDRVTAVGAARIRSWQNFRWQLFCAEPDLMDAAVARHLARMMSKWDAALTGRQDVESAAVQGALTLLGIANAAKLDVATLWTERPLEEQLRVPIGLKPDGAPLWIDLKDAADGGNGPHGLMIGMTGSGKSTLLKTLVFGLLVRHSPDTVQVVLADFKDEAGFDAFAGYPHVVAVISNMEEKKSLVERFGETLYGLMEQRGQIFHETGQQVQGAAFESLRDYNEARRTPAGAHLPPMPFMIIIVDEFSLMLNDHREMADVFDTLTRRGRSQGLFFLFASQTLDEGVIKKIPDNTQYRIGLKVASGSISRRVIGNEEAYHILDGKNAKGTGFFVRAPGAEPVKFRGFLLPNRYQPPTTINRRVIAAEPRARLFTAGRVQPDSDTVIETEVVGESVIEGPPRSLILTVGPQLAQASGKRPPQLWSPPLDDPIPLDKVLGEAAQLRDGPVPWWPLGELDRPRQLSHTLLTYSIDQGNASIMGMDSGELSMVVQTFILAAAKRYCPSDIGFYALAYGGPQLAAVKDLPHVGAIGGADRKELTLRIFGDLDAVVAGRRRLFDQHDVSSMEEYRRRRSQGETALDDGYPTDMFLIIDGWEAFLGDNTSAMHPKNPHRHNVERLIGAGRGMHVLVTSSDWVPLGQALQSKLSCRWELKLTGASVSQVRARVDDKMVRPQDRIPADQPGRGINSSGDVIRFAVGRTDGQASMEDLDVKVRETVTQISDHYTAMRPAPKPRLLPPSIDAGDLRQEQLRGEKFALGLRARDLQPLVIDFAQEPLLAVYGDSTQDKTALIKHLLRAVVARRKKPLDYANDETIVCVFDISRHLSEETRLMVEGEDYYETDAVAITNRLAALDQVLEGRTPPEGLTWEEKRNWRFAGPTIYLFIDALDAIPATVQIQDRVTASGPPLQPRMVQVWPALIRHLANAARIGLRVIMTHKAAGAYTVEVSHNTVPGTIGTLRPNRILLSSRSTNTSDKVGGMKFEEDLPAGRGYVIGASADNEGYVQLAKPIDSGLPPC